jgi:hypothetical protein
MGGSTDRGKLISSLTLVEWTSQSIDPQGLLKVSRSILDLVEELGYSRCRSTTAWTLSTNI